MNELKKRIIRLGVYGLALKDTSILLHIKTSGPYTGQLSLPGGGVEFGETIEHTLKREIREELAMSFESMHLWDNLTYVEDINFRADEIYHFACLIYKIEKLKPIQGAIAEEEFDWYEIKSLDLNKLVPFTKQVLKKIVKSSANL